MGNVMEIPVPGDGNHGGREPGRGIEATEGSRIHGGAERGKTASSANVSTSHSAEQSSLHRPAHL